jgi:hypothetical protein
VGIWGSDQVRKGGGKARQDRRGERAIEKNEEAVRKKREKKKRKHRLEIAHGEKEE